MIGLCIFRRMSLSICSMHILNLTLAFRELILYLYCFFLFSRRVVILRSDNSHVTK